MVACFRGNLCYCTAFINRPLNGSESWWDSKQTERWFIQNSITSTTKSCHSLFRTHLFRRTGFSCSYRQMDGGGLPRVWAHGLWIGSDSSLMAERGKKQATRFFMEIFATVLQSSTGHWTIPKHDETPSRQEMIRRKKCCNNKCHKSCHKVQWLVGCLPALFLSPSFHQNSSIESSADCGTGFYLLGADIETILDGWKIFFLLFFFLF